MVQQFGRTAFHFLHHVMHLLAFVTLHKIHLGADDFCSPKLLLLDARKLRDTSVDSCTNFLGFWALLLTFLLGSYSAPVTRVIRLFVDILIDN